MIAHRARPAPAPANSATQRAQPAPASAATQPAQPAPARTAATVELPEQAASQPTPTADPAPPPVGPAERRVYLPLGFDPDVSAWVPIGELLGLPTSELSDQLAAARVCAAHLVAGWASLSRLARTVRAFCEHPGLDDFDGDGIDGEMLRDAARALSLAVDWFDKDIAHLLDPADPDQAILIAGVPHRVSPETGLIEPHSPAPDPTASDAAGE